MPDLSSPFDWQGLGTEEDREAARRELIERADRMARLFRFNEEGAAFLAELRRQVLLAPRGAQDKAPYTLGYMDGQADIVRQIDQLIRIAEEGIDGTE